MRVFILLTASLSPTVNILLLRQQAPRWKAVIAESMIGETTMPMAERHLKTPASSIAMTASLSKGEMGNLWVFSRYLFQLQPGSSPSFLHQPQVVHHPVVLVRLSGHSV
jgi:hypothetical protein